jgi:flagellar biosynthesis protein FliQ
MTDNQVVHIGLLAMTMAAKLAAPTLLTALLVGFAISLFQSVTQIQEATLSFVPKAIGVGLALLVTGNWMLHELVSFTTGLFDQIPQLLSAG